MNALESIPVADLIMAARHLTTARQGRKLASIERSGSHHDTMSIVMGPLNCQSQLSIEPKN